MKAVGSITISELYDGSSQSVILNTYHPLEGGGYLGSGEYGLRISVTERITLLTCSVYAQEAGSFPVRIRNSGNSIVYFDKTYTLEAGHNKLIIDFTFLPDVGTYNISAYGSRVPTYRRINTNTSYPLEYGIFSVIESSTTNGYYYYFYDLELSGVGIEAPTIVNYGDWNNLPSDRMIREGVLAYYNGSTYSCIKSHGKLGSYPPTNTTYWTKVADKGDQGDTGEQGPTGPTGPQGIPGPKGTDGSSLYTWVKFADNSSGGGMSDNPAGKKYLGLAYNKTTPTESTTAGDYTWSKIEGDQGNPGPAGEDGESLFTWVRYADNASGSGMSSSPTGKEYIGIAYNKSSPTPSSTPGDYTWSLYKGPKGDKGDTGDTGSIGPEGPRGAAAIGLGIKVNYSAFGTDNPGEVYLHGFDNAGDPADVNGFIYYQDQRLTVNKRMVNPAAVLDGFLVLEIGTGNPYAARYDYLTGNFIIRDGSYGKNDEIVDAEGWIFIGRIENAELDYTHSASLYDRAKDFDAAEKEVLAETIFSKPDISDAEFQALIQRTGTEFFERLAAYEAFITTLFAQNAFIHNLVTRNIAAGTPGAFEFNVLTYDEEGEILSVPTWEVKKNSTVVFKIEPDTGNITIGDYDGGAGARWDHATGQFSIRGSIQATSGTFSGRLTSGPLSTELATPGINASASPPAELWSGQDLFDTMSLADSATLQSVSGSYQANAITQATKRSGARATIQYRSDDRSFKGSANTDVWQTLMSFTVQQGTDRLRYQTKCSGEWTRIHIYVYRDGSLIHHNSSSRTSTGWNYYTRAVLPGDEIVFRGSNATWAAYAARRFETRCWEETISGDGVLVRRSTGQVHVINRHYHTQTALSVLVTHGATSFNSSTMTIYRKGDQICNQFTDLPMGEAQRIANGGVLVHNGSTLYPITVTRYSGYVSFEIPGQDDRTVRPYAGDGINAVAYTTLSVNLSTLSGENQVKVTSILPKHNITYDLGSESMRFRGIYGETIEGDVNSQGTSHKVWGAVFN